MEGGDGLATEDDAAASPLFLPLCTQQVGLKGGNHTQPGWYEPQAGGSEATISREEQQAHGCVMTSQSLGQFDRGAMRRIEDL